MYICMHHTQAHLPTYIHFIRAKKLSIEYHLRLALRINIHIRKVPFLLNTIYNMNKYF